jgi:rubredoxin
MVYKYDKEKKKEYNRRYLEKYAEQLKEQIECPVCGIMVCRYNYSNHQKTKNHLFFLTIKEMLKNI